MNEQNNFTFSSFWKESVYNRFEKNEILNINNLLFSKSNYIYKCLHFFDFLITSQEYDKIFEYINNGFIFRFNYIDQNTFQNIKNWGIDNNLDIKIVDQWDAPKLKLFSCSISEYLKNACGKQTKKNYLKYKKNINNFIYLDSKKEDINKLWNDVLLVDRNSWKFREKSDMKSLDREDLQYKKFLMENKEDSFLNVVYKDKLPLAYSLFFKNKLTKQWYAVKWGASDIGRKCYTGFYCLYNHLEKLEDLEGKINIDFWGRRSSTYNSLKNYSENRYHILIEKKEDKYEG